MLLLTQNGGVDCSRAAHQYVDNIGSELTDSIFTKLQQLSEDPMKEHSVSMELRDLVQETISTVTDAHGDVGNALLLDYMTSHLYRCTLTHTLLLMVPRLSALILTDSDWLKRKLPAPSSPKVDEIMSDGEYW